MVHAPSVSGCVGSKGIPRPHGIVAKEHGRPISFASAPRLRDDRHIAWRELARPLVLKAAQSKVWSRNSGPGDD
jgi:hypothetical protein